MPCSLLYLFQSKLRTGPFPFKKLPPCVCTRGADLFYRGQALKACPKFRFPDCATPRAALAHSPNPCRTPQAPLSPAAQPSSLEPPMSPVHHTEYQILPPLSISSSPFSPLFSIFYTSFTSTACRAQQARNSAGAPPSVMTAVICPTWPYAMRLASPNLLESTSK